MAFARTWPIRLLLRLFGLCPVVDLGEGGHGYDIEEWWESRVRCSVDGYPSGRWMFQREVIGNDLSGNDSVCDALTLEMR